MIRFSNVTKCYASGQEALSRVSFEVGQGEMVFLTGHSGAGKSTLLRLLNLIERPTRGDIYIGKNRVSQFKKRHVVSLKQAIGTVFQDPHLLSNYTVFDNVALPMQIAGYHQQEIQKRVQSSLDKVGLLQKEKLFPNMLSYGEQQRVGIARAIVIRPSIILADEPTGNLDPALSEDIMSLFESFNSMGATVLVASHDLALISTLHHRILTLHKGRMISTGGRVSDVI